MTEQNETKAPSFVRKYNVISKLVCVALAFLLWIYVTQTDSAETQSTFSGVNVYLDNTSVIESENSLYVYSGYGNLVDVTVVGRKSVIRDYTADDIRVSADVSGIKSAGEHSVRLSVSLPNGLTLASLSADTVTIRADEKATKDIDVTARLVSGTVAEKYQLGELTPKYPTVTVTGPRTVVDDISGALIRLDLGAVTSSMTATSAIELTSASGSDIDMRYLTMSRTEMEVYVPLYTQKTLPLTVGTKYGYLNRDNSKITVSPESVTVKGDPNVLAGLESLTVDTIDEKSLLSGDSTRMVDIVAPDGVEIEDGTESAVVRVEHIGTVTKSFTVDSFTVTGASDLRYSVTTESVTVTLRGTLSDLGKITERDITATVDLSGYADSDVSGSITEALEISVASATVYEIGEYTVQVQIG